MNDESEMLAIIGPTIIDGNGGTPIEDGVVLIDGKRILRTGDRSIEIPPRSKKLAASGKFVIPGLIAPHNYLVDGTFPTTTMLYEGRYEEVIIEAAQLALKGGVTTVFDAWGPRDPLIKARDAIHQGRATGARIYLCGNWVGVGGPFSDDFRPHYKETMGPSRVSRVHALWEAGVGEELTRMSLEDVRSATQAYVHSGIDFVTFPINVHRSGAFQYIVFAPRIQQMIVEEGHRAGLPVQAAFATTDEGIRMALEAGVDVLLPSPWAGRPTSNDTVALIARRKLPAVLQTFPADQLEWLRQHRNASTQGVLNMLETKDLDERAFIEAGVEVVLGTYGMVVGADLISETKDSAPPGIYDQLLGEGHINGMRALQEKGMSPMAVLMATTRNTAKAFKVDKDLGTLEAGKFADLLILENNPLEDVENYRNIHLVMKEGKVVDRDALPTQRLITAPPPSALHR